MNALHQLLSSYVAENSCCTIADYPEIRNFLFQLSEVSPLNQAWRNESELIWCMDILGSDNPAWGWQEHSVGLWTFFWQHEKMPLNPVKIHLYAGTDPSKSFCIIQTGSLPENSKKVEADHAFMLAQINSPIKSINNRNIAIDLMHKTLSNGYLDINDVMHFFQRAQGDIR